ncbi:hypothetical protein C8R43DRAFT_959879 [Mycena crocata]|nr:hypothetical protein C8R43DRAFT_959879 [Mycena crocata]
MLTPAHQLNSTGSCSRLAITAPVTVGVSSHVLDTLTSTWRGSAAPRTARKILFNFPCSAEQGCGPAARSAPREISSSGVPASGIKSWYICFVHQLAHVSGAPRKVFFFWISREQGCAPMSYAAPSIFSTLSTSTLGVWVYPVGVAPPTKFRLDFWCSRKQDLPLQPLSSREHYRRCAPARNIKFDFSRSRERDYASLRPLRPLCHLPQAFLASRALQTGPQYQIPFFAFRRARLQVHGLHKQLCNFNSKGRVLTSGVTRQIIYLKFVETFRRTLSGIPCPDFNYFCVPLRVFERVEFNSSNDMFNTALLLEFQVQKYCRSQLRRINTPYQLKTSTFYFN